jgi:hypothetical protein
MAHCGPWNPDIPLQAVGDRADTFAMVAVRVSRRSSSAPLTERALLPLAFLLGLYVLARAAAGLLVGANVALFAAAGRVQGQLVLVTLFVASAVPLSPAYRSTSAAGRSSWASSVPSPTTWAWSRPTESCSSRR